MKTESELGLGHGLGHDKNAKVGVRNTSLSRIHIFIAQKHKIAQYLSRMLRELKNRATSIARKTEKIQAYD
jgi:hypothetical protein